MSKIFPLRTILLTLIGTGVASSLVALPMQKNANGLADSTTEAELVLSQTDYNNRLAYNQPNDSFKNIVGLTGLAIGTGLIGYHLSRSQRNWASSLPTINNSNSAILTRISPKLRRELLRLVHNQQTADRLLAGTSNSHPGRSANWVAEKVIYDLKRDR